MAMLTFLNKFIISVWSRSDSAPSYVDVIIVIINQQEREQKKNEYSQLLCRTSSPIDLPKPASLILHFMETKHKILELDFYGYYYSK